MTRPKDRPRRARPTPMPTALVWTEEAEDGTRREVSGTGLTSSASYSACFPGGLSLNATTGLISGVIVPAPSADDEGASPGLVIVPTTTFCYVASGLPAGLALDAETGLVASGIGQPPIARV